MKHSKHTQFGVTNEIREYARNAAITIKAMPSMRQRSYADIARVVVAALMRSYYENKTVRDVLVEVARDMDNGEVLIPDHAHNYVALRDDLETWLYHNK